MRVKLILKPYQFGLSALALCFFEFELSAMRTDITTMQHCCGYNNDIKRNQSRSKCVFSDDYHLRQFFYVRMIETEEMQIADGYECEDS